jgi:GTPase
MTPEIRIASIGNVDSAKTTTISVIANNTLDNGRGKARKHIIKHPHEESTGRTSSITQHYIETDDKTFGFIDLAGHEKYLKTTLTGLNGCYIDYAMVTIGADRGLIGMTKEHLTLAIVLKIPIFIVITKMDIATEHKLVKIKQRLTSIFSHPLAGQKELYFINKDNSDSVTQDIFFDSNKIPVFEVSNVTGFNIDILRKFIYGLKKYKEIGNSENKNPLFKIDDTFKLDGIGIILSGIVQEGVIHCNQKMNIGPFNGKYIEVLVKSIHDNFKRNIDSLSSGHCGCVNIKVVNQKKNTLKRNSIKRGHILIGDPYSIRRFDADVTILHHPTTIKLDYEPVIHCGSVRQTARIKRMDKELVRAGDKANVTFEFKFKPEFIQLNSDIVFREGNTKGIGRITKIHGD